MTKRKRKKRELPAKDDPGFARTCNRCHHTRGWTVALCPKCGCPEFSQGRPGYFVKTWDAEKHEYTEQEGVSSGPYTLFGLRLAIRQLQAMGYDGGKQDASILVYKV